MRLTIRSDATRLAAKNFLAQQARFDRFSDCYYRERPDQALGLKFPEELYQPSPKPKAKRALPREAPLAISDATTAALSHSDGAVMKRILMIA